jgi:hypothetical protein
MDINFNAFIDVLDIWDWTFVPTDIPLSIPTGWACPRCGKINAPWVTSCDCYPYSSYPVYYYTSYTPYTTTSGTGCRQPISHTTLSEN